jgi:uncharacterized protein YjiS (DUF1127 family)
MEHVMPNIAFARSGSRHESAQFGRRITQVFVAIELALQVRRERRMLAGLSDGMLKDLGLTRADVHRETGRALWDVPAERK